MLLISRTRLLTCLLAVCLLQGCASVVSNLTGKMADDLAGAILNSNDVETVRQGIPAYLLLIDSFLLDDPDNESLLLAAAQLNGAFTFFVDEERGKLLATKALGYSRQAACSSRPAWCADSIPFKAFQVEVDQLSAEDVPVFYGLGVAWTTWMQLNSSDWNAIAQLAKVRYLMEKIVALDGQFDQGGPHLYLGGLETVLPAAMGGRPEIGRKHFEQAVEISEGRFLMAKVVYAEQYARLVFDQELHDRLLNEVLAANPVVPGMTLINTLAQQEARRLLEDGKEYF